MKTDRGIDDAVIVERGNRIRVTRDMEMDVIVVAGKENNVQARTDIWIEAGIIAGRVKTIQTKISTEIDTVKIGGRDKMIPTKTSREIGGTVMACTEHMIQMNTGMETNNVRIATRRMTTMTMNAVAEVTVQGARTTQVMTRIEGGVDIVIVLMMTLRIMKLKHVKDKGVIWRGQTPGKGE
jgi:hypothetical protein